MKRDDRERDAGCPLLMPGASKGRAGFQVAVYCRLPNGRVRVPTPDQLGSLCFAGRYRDCPGYRRWARSRLVPAASLP
ncbi:MAG: hypothetical protein Q7W02_21625 [Candidatus Rokubacteria bacterium]|nr:hypothetical protein [Candidatus Rokubacteria bacterium]